MTEKGSELTIKLRERPLPSRLRYLADLLDKRGGDEVIRFAIGTVLIAIATEMELLIDGGAGGTAIPVCRCGHSWSDHSDHGEHCLVCDCPAARYDGREVGRGE